MLFTVSLALSYCRDESILCEREPTLILFLSKNWIGWEDAFSNSYSLKYDVERLTNARPPLSREIIPTVPSLRTGDLFSGTTAIGSSCGTHGRVTAADSLARVIISSAHPLKLLPRLPSNYSSPLRSSLSYHDDPR